MAGHVRDAGNGFLAPKPNATPPAMKYPTIPNTIGGGSKTLISGLKPGAAGIPKVKKSK